MGTKQRLKHRIGGRIRDKETRLVDQTLSVRFPSVESYRSRFGTIRVRVVDARFEKKSRVQRERMILPLIRTLPEEVQADIVMLLLLSPGESESSVQNFEFEHPERRVS